MYITSSFYNKRYSITSIIRHIKILILFPLIVELWCKIHSYMLYTIDVLYNTCNTIPLIVEWWCNIHSYVLYRMDVLYYLCHINRLVRMCSIMALLVTILRFPKGWTRESDFCLVFLSLHKNDDVTYIVTCYTGWMCLIILVIL
jgi:hypothetical protein